MNTPMNGTGRRTTTRVLRRRVDRRVSTGAKISEILSLPKKDVKVLDRVFSEVSVPAGTYLCWEGSNIVQLAVVLEGRVKVQRGGKDVCELGEGAVVGETRVIDSSKSMTADVVCVTPCRVAVAGRSDVPHLREARDFMTLLERTGRVRQAALS